MNIRLRKKLILIFCVLCGILLLSSCGANRTVAEVCNRTAKIYVNVMQENESPEKFYKEVKKAFDGKDIDVIEIVGTSSEILRLAAADHGDITGLIFNSDENGEKLNSVISLYENVNALSFKNNVDLSDIIDMPNIKTLNINCINMNDPNMAGLSHFPNVQILAIENAENLEKFASYFIEMNELAELTFIDCSPVPMGGELHKSYAQIKKLRIVNGKPVEEAAGYEVGQNQYIKQNAEAFAEEMISKYAAVAKNAVYTPKIEGKCLIALQLWTHDKIKMDCRDTSSEFSFNNSGGILPDDLFAASADECDTLIYVWSESTKTGEYSDGSIAYDDTYYMRIMNLKETISYQPVIIAGVSSTFIKFEGQAGHGYFDYDKIYEYINALIE